LRGDWAWLRFFNVDIPVIPVFIREKNTVFVGRGFR
jgi:hypothetical protein